MGSSSIRLLRVGWGTVSENDEVFLSRFKLALGLVLIAGVVILIATVYLKPDASSQAVSELDRRTTERGRAGEGIAVRDTNVPKKSPDSDAVLNSLIKRPGESDPYDTPGPRMQRKQIKMH
jgi:hypothetical protein